MNNVLVEAGPTLAGEFVHQRLSDELKVFMAPKLMGADAMPVFNLHLDTMSEAMDLTISDITAVGTDWLLTCQLKNS